MKNYKNYQFFIPLVFLSFFVFPLSVLADEAGKIDRDAELKNSVMSLKQSAAKVRLENKKLSEAIKAIPGQITALKEELERLAQKKSFLMDSISESQMDKKNEERELSFAKTGIDRLRNELKVLTDQETKISEEVHAKEKKIERIKTQIEQSSNLIDSLEKKFDLSDNRDQIRALNDEKNNLQALVEESEYTLKDLEKEFKIIREKNAKPLDELKELEKKKDLLKQDVAIVGDEYQVAVEEGQRLEKEIRAANEKNTSELEQLDDDLSGLKKEKEEISATLTAAREKLQGKNIVFDALDKEAVQMKKSLDLIQREKEKLDTEILFLQDKIEEFQAQKR